MPMHKNDSKGKLKSNFVTPCLAFKSSILIGGMVTQWNGKNP